MCVVLDTSTFAAFFNSGNREHANYAPVLHWVVNGRGKLVLGGDKYRKEMVSARRYLRFFVNLERARKLVSISDAEVNRHQAEVKRLESDRNFDDSHLVAIVRASGCRIVCTNDRRAIPYLKDAKFYRGMVKKPKIYRSKRNAAILCDDNIADVCRPTSKLSRLQIAALEIAVGVTVT